MSKKSSSAPAARVAGGWSFMGSLLVRRLVWLGCFFIWTAMAASVLSFSPADPPGHAVAPLQSAEMVRNWMGPAGAAFAYQAFTLIGSGTWVIVLCGAVYLGLIAFRGGVAHLPLRAVGVLMIALAFSGFHALFVPGWSAFPEGGGGLVAISGVHELSTRFGPLGAALWLALMGVIGLTVAFDDWFTAISRAATKPALLMARVAPLVVGMGARMARLVPVRAAARVNDIDDDGGLKSVSRKMKSLPSAVDLEMPRSRRGAEAKAAAPAVEEEVDEAPAESAERAPRPSRRGKKTAITEIEDTAEQEEVESGAELDEDDAEEFDDSGAEAITEDGETEDEEEKEFSAEELREKIARLPVRFAGQERRSATSEDLELLRSQRANEEEADKKYVFPGLDLLINPEDNYEKELETYVRDQATSLETALHTYNIKGEVVGIESGPVITLYQVRLAPGTKVSSITAVSSDIARSLKAVNIRVVPNTEGLDTVGIEVPNRKKEKVRLKELMTRSDATSKMKLPLFLGKDASGRPLVIDLATLPHMLIAGTTGSGKSVCMNAIIMGFLYTQKPSDMKLVLVDPKVVELSQFKDIPHLMCPVVTDMSKAAAILEWAVGKMDERYELLAEAGCRDIASYNGLGWEELKERFNPQSEAEEARIPRKLPYMVFIIDELADLMMTNKEVEGSIVRIAQKARAVGIHLILATQRPQANVVTGLIKSNMPGRLSFKVASGMDSRIVLDQKGGEILLGQGDMLFITPRSSTPLRAQGTLVDDAEIRNVVRFVRQVSGPSFERQLVQIRGGGGGGEPAADFGTAEEHEKRMLESAQEDPLFDRAVEIVLETERGSVSLLQRRLAIGYTRASRLIELMGMAGIIGGHKGSVAREVVMTLEEWQAMKKLAQQDAEASAAEGPGAQAKLFPEPVTAREIVEAKKQATPSAPASAEVSASAIAAPTVAKAGASAMGAAAEEPPFDTDENPSAKATSSMASAAAAADDAVEIEEMEEAEGSIDEHEGDEALALEVEAESEEEEGEEESEDDGEAVDEAEEGEDEEEEVEDSVEDEAEEEEDLAEEGSAEADDEYEYEYEYVEVEEGEELEDGVEVVGEEEEEEESEPTPDVVVKPRSSVKEERSS